MERGSIAAGHGPTRAEEPRHSIRPLIAAPPPLAPSFPPAYGHAIATPGRDRSGRSACLRARPLGPVRAAHHPNGVSRGQERIVGDPKTRSCESGGRRLVPETELRGAFPQRPDPWRASARNRANSKTGPGLREGTGALVESNGRFVRRPHHRGGPSDFGTLGSARRDRSGSGHRCADRRHRARTKSRGGDPERETHRGHRSTLRQPLRYRLSATVGDEEPGDGPAPIPGRVTASSRRTPPSGRLTPSFGESPPCANAGATADGMRPKAGAAAQAFARRAFASLRGRPTCSPASRMPSQVTGSTGIPSAIRFSRAIRSGSPGTRTGSSGSAGGEEVT